MTSENTKNTGRGHPVLRRVVRGVVAGLLAVASTAVWHVAAAPAAGAAATPDEAAMAQDILARINTERAARGIAPAAWRPGMGNTRSLSSAQEWAEHMRTLGRCQHAPGGGLWNEDITCSADSYGPTAGRSVHNFMDSPGHRSDLMDPNVGWFDIGVACSDGGMRTFVVVRSEFIDIYQAEVPAAPPGKVTDLGGARCYMPPPPPPPTFWPPAPSTTMPVPTTAPPATQPPTTAPPATQPPTTGSPGPTTGPSTTGGGSPSPSGPGTDPGGANPGGPGGGPTQVAAGPGGVPKRAPTPPPPSCDQIGRTDIPSDDPAYKPYLDADGDGVACEAPDPTTGQTADAAAFAGAEGIAKAVCGERTDIAADDPDYRDYLDPDGNGVACEADDTTPTAPAPAAVAEAAATDASLAAALDASDGGEPGSSAGPLVGVLVALVTAAAAAGAVVARRRNARFGIDASSSDGSAHEVVVP